jgi:hypothetical protein
MGRLHLWRPLKWSVACVRRKSTSLYMVRVMTVLALLRHTTLAKAKLRQRMRAKDWLLGSNQALSPCWKSSSKRRFEGLHEVVHGPTQPTAEERGCDDVPDEDRRVNYCERFFAGGSTCR